MWGSNGVGLEGAMKCLRECLRTPSPIFAAIYGTWWGSRSFRARQMVIFLRTHRFVHAKCPLMVSMPPVSCKRLEWRCDDSAAQVRRNSAQAAVLVHVCRFRLPRGTHLSNHDGLRLWAICRFIACLCFWFEIPTRTLLTFASRLRNLCMWVISVYCMFRFWIELPTRTLLSFVRRLRNLSMWVLSVFPVACVGHVFQEVNKKWLNTQYALATVT